MQQTTIPLISSFLLCLALSCTPTNPSTSPQEFTQLDSLRQDPMTLLSALSQQIASDPENYALYQDRAELYYQLDSLEKAKADIQQAILLHDSGPDLYYMQGFLAFVQNDTATARESFEIARGLGSQNPEVYYQLGQIFFFQQKYDQALFQYREAAKYDPDEPLYVFSQGYLEESRGNFRQANKVYQEALEIDSVFDKALLRLHDLYLTTYGNELEAIKYNTQLRNAKLGHPLANYNEGNYQLRRAKLFQNGGDTDSFGQALNNSILHYTIAIDNDPDFALGYYARGLAYFEGRQRINEAIQDFQKSIEIDPTLAQAHFMLGSLFEGNGDLQTALFHYKEAARLKPDGQGFQQAVKEVSAQLQ